MHLFLNGLAASAAADLPICVTFFPSFPLREEVQVTAAVSPQLRCEFCGLPRRISPEIEPPPATHNAFLAGADLRCSRRSFRSGCRCAGFSGNFALRKSPVPQILLSRNSLYTSTGFLRDCAGAVGYGFWLETRIKGEPGSAFHRWADSYGRAQRGICAGAARVVRAQGGGNSSRFRP